MIRTTSATQLVRDISIVMSPATAEWPGDTPFSCGWASRIADGASVNVSTMHTSPHVGTHADAPRHVRDDAASSERLPLDAFLGPALVITIAGDPRDITAGDATSRVPAGTARVLLRTGHTIAGGGFPDDWPALSTEAARELVRRGVRLLGVDAPSVDRRHSKGLAVHHALFDAGASILENLDLRGVPDGKYELIAAPLLVAGLDAAPARALLRALPRNSGASGA